ncbi:Glucosamine-6-phosphate isomerase (Glucosamine-6-phosphate deaminase) (GNPDA) (GlcN6P deaminase) [Rhizina undulata]
MGRYRVPAAVTERSTTLGREVYRTKNFLCKENFVSWKFHPRGTKFEPARDAGTVIRAVYITQLEAGTTATPEYGEIDESYNLTIPSMEITACYGFLHGLTTLSQLFYGTKANKPKFAHRGLNIDVSQQWYPKEDILKTIDALSWNKMNRLHLHATDAQSWPLEISAMPELAEKGSYADNLTYTPEDLQDILKHTEQRGFQVIVEIDMPGHTTSIAESHPELITGRNIQPNWDTYAAQPPSGSLKLDNADVEAFLEKFLMFADLLPRLRDHTVYFHTGGDEVNKNVYRRGHQFQRNFGAQTRAPELFRLRPRLGQEARHESPSVGGNDCGLGAATRVEHDRSDVDLEREHEDGRREGWLDFGRRVYFFNPTASLTEQEAKLILGGEIHICSEQIDAVNLDSTLWPRGSAAAEVPWNGRTDANGVNTTFADASPRLAEFRKRMAGRGVGANYSPIQQRWCHQNVGGCALN